MPRPEDERGQLPVAVPYLGETEHYCIALAYNCQEVCGHVVFQSLDDHTGSLD